MISECEKKVKNDEGEGYKEKWEDKKNRNMNVSKKFFKLGLKKRAIRMSECGKEIDFYICPCCGRKKIRYAQLCRDRFCPICNWRLSLKRYAEMLKIMGAVSKKGNFTYTFLTLTIKNCATNELKDTLFLMSKAWDRMLKRKYFKENVCGWAKSIEITYNKNKKTLHPHYHIILVWNENEKVEAKKEQEEIRQIWKEVLEIDYNPVIDHREIYNKDGEQGDIIAGVLETFKYAVKDKDLIDMPLNIFRNLVLEVKNKRLLSFGGIIKETKNELNVGNLEKAENIESEDIEINCDNCNIEMQEYIAKWSFNDDTYDLYKIEKDKNKGMVG